MTEREDPWAALVEAARRTVKQAEDGDSAAARDVLSHCVVVLEGLLEHRQLPDPERSVHLEFLLRALRLALDEGVRADKALGLYVGSRPRIANSFERDFVMFVKVGRELDRLRREGAEDQTVAAARAVVARRMRKPVAFAETLRKAWERFGALKGWCLVRDEWEKR